MPYIAKETFSVNEEVKLRGTKLHKKQAEEYEEQFLDMIVKISHSGSIHIEYDSDTIYKTFTFTSLKYISIEEIAEFIDRNVNYNCSS